MKIDGKNIILTGASSGIGLEMLKLLLEYSNVKIIAVARNIKNIPKKEGVIFPFSADLSNELGVESVFNYARANRMCIDIFIANAGYAYMEKLNNANWKHIEDIYSLNVFSPIYSLQKFVEQNLHQSKYFIIISSAVAFVPLPYYSLYNSTKAAIHQFMKGYEYENDSERVKLMTVYPVATRTSFFEKASHANHPPIPFLSQEPLIVAESIINGIEKNKKNVYPSILFRVFKQIGNLFPSIYKIYSWNEKRKVGRYFDL